MMIKLFHDDDVVKHNSMVLHDVEGPYPRRCSFMMRIQSVRSHRHDEPTFPAIFLV